jgi:hypothetical protein
MVVADIPRRSGETQIIDMLLNIGKSMGKKKPKDELTSPGHSTLCSTVYYFQLFSFVLGA